MSDENGHEIERCTIDRWRGYRTSSFFVSLDGETAFLESRPFRWRKPEPPPDSGRPREAFDELVAALHARGWQRAGGVLGAWYAVDFVRFADRRSRALVPTPRVVEPEPEPAHEPPAEPPEQWFDEPVQIAAAPEPAAAPVPEPTSRARRWRRPRPIMVVASLGVCVTVGSLALGVAGLGTKHSHTILVPVAAAAPRHVAAAPTPVVTTPTQRPVTTHAVLAKKKASHPSQGVKLSIAATKSSWLEVRRGSPTGRVVYAGQLDPGRVIRVQAPRIWTRFGAAGNLVVRVDGRRVSLMGTLEKLFVR